MADSIKADPNITGSGSIQGSKPGTYKGFDGKEYKLGLPEATQAGQAESQLANNRALRNYQATQGSLNLKNALRQIDRTSMDAYKNIANDYAARGMQRSGGYTRTDDKAYEATQEARVAEMDKLKNLLDTNNMTDSMDIEQRNNAIWDIISKFVGTEAGKKLNEIKG